MLKPLEDRGTLCESQRRSPRCSSRRAGSTRPSGRARGDRDGRAARPRLGLDDELDARRRPRRAGPRRRGRGAPAGGASRRSERTGFRAIEHLGARALVQFLRERGRDEEAAVYAERPRRARVRADRADRLSRLLVGRLADHGRRALEARERLAQRLGAQRALAVGQVLRLVAVRVRDVGEVDVERRARLEHASAASSAPANASTSVKPPSLVACMCAKSSTGRTQPSCAAMRARRRACRGRGRGPSPRRRTERPALPLEPRAELAELLDDGGERLLARAAEQEAGVEDDELGAAGDGDPAEWSSMPIAMLYFFPRSAWPMNAASGACTESAIPARARARRAAAPKS